MNEVQQMDSSTMIQLPSNLSLPLQPALLQSSGRNVAQIRVSACWGGWETGKQREGRERQETNCSRFTQAKGLLVHLRGLHSLLHSQDQSQSKASQWPQTSGEERPWCEIPLNSYKVRLQHGCIPAPLKKCVSVAVKYPWPSELPR